MIEKSNVKDIYPLTPLQEGILFHAIYSGGSEYFEQICYRIRGRLDTLLFQKAWNELVRRHDVLRTLFIYLNVPRPLQIVLKQWRIDFSTTDLSGLSRVDAEERIVSIKEQDRSTPFDLSRDPLTRVAVVFLSDDETDIIWSLHHIILDGWSLGILQGELLEIYSSLMHGRRLSLPDPVSFSGYVTWIGTLDHDESLRFWQKYLEGFSRPTGLPRYFSSESVPMGRGHLLLRLDRRRSDALTTLAAENNVTLSLLLQALWGVLLCSCNGVDDAVFAATVSGRSHSLTGIEGMVGLFINTVPVRVRLAVSETFTGLLSAMQAAALASSLHHWTPLADIQVGTSLKQALLDHVLIFENYPLDARIKGFNHLPKGDGFDVIRYDVRESTNYSFELAIVPGSEIEFKFGYNTSVYGHEQIRRVARLLEQMIDILFEHPNTPLAYLHNVPLCEDALSELLCDSTGIVQPWPEEKSIADLFRDQAARFSDAIAVIAYDRTITYGQLEQLSEYCALHLQTICALVPEEAVGVMVGRNSNLPVALLGILKAGGVYLPIDPDQPESRIRHIISDSGLQMIIADDESMSRLAAFTDLAKVIEISTLLKAVPSSYVLNGPSSSSAAYIIYTSGSTGSPKGVLLQHGGFVNMILDQIRTFGITASDRCLLFSSCAFDGSMSEIFLALHSGAALVISNQDEVRDPELFSRLLESTGTTVATLPPVYLNVLRACGASLDPLRVIVTAGEAAIAADVLHYASGKTVFNAYGPTETSVCSAIHRIDITCHYQSSIPIGSPIANSQMLLCDEQMKLVPYGVAGEICIAGPGLARGYLNNPEMTAVRFTAHPFNSGERLYRTGDMGRHIAKGVIEFLGRKDDQVKVRGFRIECGEVEQALLRNPAVEGAVVVVHGDGIDKELVGFILSKENLDLSSLRSGLSGQLPSYMHPSRFFPLTSFPRNANGKVDRTLLATLVNLQELTEKGGETPSTPMEKSLAAIWEHILGRGEVLRYDSFFDLGGQSITAIRVMAAIHQQLGIRLALPELFRNSTLYKLAIECERIATFSSEYQKQPHMMLGNAGNVHIFAFPPLNGYPVAYGRLAELLHDVSFHGFTFIESCDRLARYSDMIDQMQPTGSLILFGYSAGGNLAFEVAKELENRGRVVSDLILLDSWKRYAHSPVAENLQDWTEGNLPDPALYGNISELMESPHIRELVLCKLRSFLAYTEPLTTSGLTKGTIHLLRAADSDEIAGLSQNWRDHTLATCNVYESGGSHLEMLKEPWVSENAGVINSLLERIGVK